MLPLFVVFFGMPLTQVQTSPFEASVFAVRYDWGTRPVLVIHNLGAKPYRTSFKVEPAAGWGGLIDLFGQGDFTLKDDGTVSVELERYGCRWLRARRAGQTILL